MIHLELTDQDIDDITEALDDPATPEQNKTKRLVIRMHHEGAKQAVARIESLTGIRLSESQARRFMKGLGMKIRKACSIPGKANPQLQFEFYTTTLLPKLEEAGRAERKLFFVDAAHFVMGAFLGMIWCFARVLVKTPPGRKRYSVLGAIDSHNQELISIRTTKNINSLSVVALLEKIRKKHPDTEITLVMDNAAYQRCYFVRDHAEALGIELLFLPSYSPNLGPHRTTMEANKTPLPDPPLLRRLQCLL